MIQSLNNKAIINIKKDNFRKSGFNGLIKIIKKHWFIYLMVAPGLILTLIFSYQPMYGLIIAFKDYSFLKGILQSPWVGLDNFKTIFQDVYFYKVIWNTVILNILAIVFGFTFTIFLALFLNEIKTGIVKKTLQTFVYLPAFVSWVVFAGIVLVVLSPGGGVVNTLIEYFKGTPINFMAKPGYFRAIIIISGIVKGSGFGTIIYLAAISGIGPELYESAYIDGAHRGHTMIYITLPRIYPTIAVLLILNVSAIFSSNFDQIFNLYNPLVYETGDVISTYLYRTGIGQGKFEVAAAIGLVFNLFSLVTVFFTNKFIEKMDVMGIF